MQQCKCCCMGGATWIIHYVAHNGALELLIETAIQLAVPVSHNKAQQQL
jgi:hypothetical protein